MESPRTSPPRALLAPDAWDGVEEARLALREAENGKRELSGVGASSWERDEAVGEAALLAGLKALGERGVLFFSDSYLVSPSRAIPPFPPPPPPPKLPASAYHTDRSRTTTMT
eukprot:CAMPEP_0197616654 /NCGR_PEP_ID=MMETSP1326-20131121/60640_1 /TAXON_ID=1155430 /ORGANISM="Genus nov. species nov., Strain RCC2288" /LENGTH=112 /DNA_ID=CAMNT_0043185541 /DNA_START=1565 /DNA_END=1903 /DNA_ORIENTATION=+